MIKFSIIIPVYNQLKYTKLSIKYLNKNTNLNEAEVIIVDNGSTDGTKSFFKGKREYRYIRNNENLGFASAVNQGIRNSRGRYYVVLNNDVLVSKGWLNRLKEVADKDKKIGLIGAMTNWISGIQLDENAIYKEYEEMELYAEGLWKKFKSEYIEYPRLRGFCVFIKKDVIDTIGGFDERFKLGNYEDDDFCLRALRTGFLCVVAKGIFVHHFGSVTFQNLDKKYDNILEGNRRRFIQKWGFDPDAGEKEKSTPDDLKESEAYDEKSIQALFEKGNELAFSGETDKAFKLYRRVLRVNPNHTETLHNLACLEFQSKNYENALKNLEKAVSLDSGFAQAFNTLGLVNYALGNKETALRYFKEAISKNINYDEAYDNYLNTAKELSIPVDKRAADFVFYTVGMPFDGNTIYEKGLGGSESALFYIARELASLGYSVKVFNKCENPGVYEGVEYGDLTDFYIFNRFCKIKVFVASRSFKPYFSKINADKKILWIHDHFESAFLDEYDFSKIDLSDIEFFTLSRWQTDMWAEGLKLPKEKFYITRNGFNPDHFSSEKNLHNKRYKLIYTSRPERGLEILLDIFPGIKKEIPEAELHVFTYVPSLKDREMKPLLEKLKQPGVIMRGSVKQSQLAEEMMESRIMAYPNIWRETSCIAAIEAQAAGLPIVSSVLAALPETVVSGKTGILIEGDPFSEDYKKKFIANVVELIKNDEKFEFLSKNARKRAFEVYTWKKIAEEWAEKFINDGVVEKIHNKKIYDKDIKQVNNKVKRAKLSLCTIVKNEEKNLLLCLESVKDIVDEMIIVDTGSTDDTVKLAESFGAEVFGFEWINDFSAARNFALSKARGEWILYLDADERLEKDSKRKLLDIINSGDDIMAVSLNQHTPQEEGSLIKSFSLDYCRLFRNHPEIRFEGKIHEQILPSINRLNGKVLKSDIVIEHFAYRISEEKRNERLKRNEKIIKDVLKENPDDSFMHFNLAKIYRLMERDSEAVEEFKKAVENNDGNMKERLIAESYTALSQLYLKNEDYSAARICASKASEMAEYEILPNYVLTALDFIEEKYSEALDKLKKILEIAEDKKKKAVAGVMDISQVFEDMGNCSFKLNDFDRAVEYYEKSVKYDDRKYSVHFNLGNVLFKLGNIEAALKEFKKALELNKDFEPAKQIINSLSYDNDK